MISERRFCVSHTSVWSEVLPQSDRFIRRINLESERYASSLPISSLSAVSGVINEAAFRVAEQAAARGVHVSKMARGDVANILDDVAKWLGFQAKDISKNAKPASMAAEAVALASNIERAFPEPLPGKLRFRPVFSGCGVVDECEADLFADSVLVEVKAGERGFLSVDLRQLLTYCALAKSGGLLDFDKVCLLNPRRGTYWIGSLRSIALGCGSPNHYQMLDDICDAMRSLTVSAM